ncbi:DUF4136 domain-containing protein [Telluribacter sp.]|jgi:hypothetical protein|uniref:DUF4136 domain-containing protein n=1 Tax=Telluribacter sp. TaxID=1978767 RepID=UPI002E0EE9C9|nr:DUF4136 domain-containing protein [Telluribacter sp.]
MTYKTSIFALVLGFLLMGCANDPLSDLSVEDSQVFITNRDKSVSFNQYQTFSIVDSVIVMGNRGTGTSLSDVDIQVLNRVIANMQQLGYRYVNPREKPDLGINVAQIRNSYLNVVSQPMSPYLGSYWGGGFYGGGLGGYGYPNYYSYYQVNENYWYLEMVDFKNPDTANKQLNVVWNAEIRGAGLFDKQYVSEVVDKVFQQSNYLRLN